MVLAMLAAVISWVGAAVLTRDAALSPALDSWWGDGPGGSPLRIAGRSRAGILLWRHNKGPWS